MACVPSAGDVLAKNLVRAQNVSNIALFGEDRYDCATDYRRSAEVGQFCMHRRVCKTASRHVARSYQTLIGRVLAVRKPNIYAGWHHTGRAIAWLGGAILVVALAFLPLTWIVLLTGGVGVALLLVRWPWLIWLILAALLPFASAQRIGPATLTDLLVGVGVALWVADGARRRTLPLHWSPVAKLAMLYTVLLLVSTSFAIDLGEGVREVIKWLELPMILLAVPAMLTVRSAQWVAAALVAAAVAQALLGLYQFVFGIGPEYFVIMGRFMRASGSFEQPNPFGGFLGLALPAVLSLALWAGGRLVRGGDSRLAAALWFSFYAGATAIIAGGLLASWSRGAWLGAATGVLIVLVMRNRRASILSAVAGLVLSVIVLLGVFTPDALPRPVVERVQDIPAYWGLTDVLSQPVTDENFSVVERIAHWVAAQRMWIQSPWFGVGPGNYAVVYPSVRLPQWEEALGHAHNIYLNVLGESGLVGLTAYLMLWVTTVAWVWHQARVCGRGRTADSHWQVAVAIGVTGLVIHVSVHNLVDNLFVRGMVVYSGLWLALVPVDRDGVEN